LAKWIAPQLRRVRALSKRSETPEGGVVLRGGANFRAGSAYRPEVATGGQKRSATAAGGGLVYLKRTVGHP